MGITIITGGSYTSVNVSNVKDLVKRNGWEEHMGGYALGVPLAVTLGFFDALKHNPHVSHGCDMAAIWLDRRFFVLKTLKCSWCQAKLIRLRFCKQILIWTLCWLVSALLFGTSGISQCMPPVCTILSLFTGAAERLSGPSTIVVHFLMTALKMKYVILQDINAAASLARTFTMTQPLCQMSSLGCAQQM